MRPAQDVMGPKNDPWEPEQTRREGRHLLTSVEVTVSNRCNMRCRHCAVGETLVAQEGERLPLDLLMHRLDELEGLRTLSITGGEPSENPVVLFGYVMPLLRYAQARGVRTQLNTNLTFALDRYLQVAPYVDVLHMTWNYPDVEAFHRIAWGNGRVSTSMSASERLMGRIIENTEALVAAGAFVSAESMINAETAPHLGSMNRFLAAMGCGRHEVHPMYPVDWALDLPVLCLDAYREALSRFLDERDPQLWALLGTLPFFPCSPLQEDQELLRRLSSAPNLSVRNCPDGRNRININAFDGGCYVTDFADVLALGNIQQEPLGEIFTRWQADARLAPYNCYCPDVGCTGPNLIIANLYHSGVDFRGREKSRQKSYRYPHIEAGS